MERLVNTDFARVPTEFRGHTLSLQLRQLLGSLDVLLEAWNAADEAGGKVDFPREKVFMQAVR